MRSLGVSSACFYPLTTEEAIRKTASMGAPCCEVFLNAFSELDHAYLKRIKAFADSAEMRICSLHPFSSFTENYFLFSSYYRRFTDTLEQYKLFFEAASILGASVFVIHGILAAGTIGDEEYFERFAALMEQGRRFGVHVCQEKVVRHRSEDPAFLKKMGSFIGEDFGVVLDVKQARRAGYDPMVFAEQLGEKVAHVHLSDGDAARDCLPPGEGAFDFKRFFALLAAKGYTGDAVIELYETSFDSDCQIKNALAFLKKTCGNYFRMI